MASKFKKSPKGMSKTDKAMNISRGYKRKVNKDSLLKKIARRYNFKLLKNKIESYGFKYSFRKFLTQFLLVAAVVTGFAYYLDVSIFGLMLMLGEVTLALPFIIDAQFNQLHQIKRFEMVRDYVGNILPIFKNNPKIARSWFEVMELVDGEMKECIQKAYDYLMNNCEDPEAEKTAFRFIEDKFPNSRIHSVHQMMYTVETKNSEDYFSSVDNMYYDVQAWISRVYGFQKELSKYRKDLIILCIFGLLCSSFSIAMFGDAEIFKGYTDNRPYQIVTTIYMMAMILCICISYIRMNGSWLIDDRTVSHEDSYYKSFQYIIKHSNKKVTKKSKFFGLICFLIGGLGVVMYILDAKNMTIMLLCILLAYLMYSQGNRRFKMHMRKVKFFLEVEYPIWMRDVSLNLHNYTVLNSIEESMITSSEIFTHYIEKFLDDVYENPASIVPYNNFLKEFEIDGVKSSMKVLFSLKSLNDSQIQEQVNSLIMRNQEMLERSEHLRNDDRLGTVKLLGFIPTFLVGLHLVASMGVLFAYMITKMMSMI